MKGKTPRYEALTTKIEQLYANIGRLKKQAQAKEAEYKQLTDNLSGWDFQNPFPILNSDINEVISKWDVDKPFSQLHILLEGYHKKIENLDKKVLELKQHQKKLVKNPDRYNNKNVTEKVALFLQEVSNTSLKNIDKVINNDIPKLHTMIDGVYAGFSKEDAQVEKNLKTAKSLKKRVNGYNRFADKFNLHQLRAESLQQIEQVIKKPNRANPSADATILKNIVQALYQCMSQILIEERHLLALAKKVDENKTRIWREDYFKLVDTLVMSAYSDPKAVEQLQRQYDTIMGVKDNEINQALNKYSQKNKEGFFDEIGRVRTTCCIRQDFYNLIEKIDAKMTADQKQLRMKILKYSGIAIASVTGITIVIVLWQWVLLFAIIISIIAYIFFKD